MPLKTGNSRRVAKSRPVCMGLKTWFKRRILHLSRTTCKTRPCTHAPVEFKVFKVAVDHN